jgi:transcriptional regulator with XRE-family HTH domain
MFLANPIKYYRTMAKLSRKNLSQLSTVYITRIIRYERYEYSLSFEADSKLIADALGIDQALLKVDHVRLNIKAHDEYIERYRNLSAKHSRVKPKIDYHIDNILVPDDPKKRAAINYFLSAPLIKMKN